MTGPGASRSLATSCVAYGKVFGHAHDECIEAPLVAIALNATTASWELDNPSVAQRHVGVLRLYDSTLSSAARCQELCRRLAPCAYFSYEPAAGAALCSLRAAHPEQRCNEYGYLSSADSAAAAGPAECVRAPLDAQRHSTEMVVTIVILISLTCFASLLAIVACWRRRNARRGSGRQSLCQKWFGQKPLGASRRIGASLQLAEDAPASTRSVEGELKDAGNGKENGHVKNGLPINRLELPTSKAPPLGSATGSVSNRVLKTMSLSQAVGETGLPACASPRRALASGASASPVASAGASHASPVLAMATPGWLKAAAHQVGLGGGFTSGHSDDHDIYPEMQSRPEMQSSRRRPRAKQLSRALEPSYVLSPTSDMDLGGS